MRRRTADVATPAGTPKSRAHRTPGGDTAWRARLQGGWQAISLTAHRLTGPILSCPSIIMIASDPAIAVWVSLDLTQSQGPRCLGCLDVTARCRFDPDWSRAAEGCCLKKPRHPEAILGLSSIGPYRRAKPTNAAVHVTAAAIRMGRDRSGNIGAAIRTNAASATAT